LLSFSAVRGAAAAWEGGATKAMMMIEDDKKQAVQ